MVWLTNAHTQLSSTLDICRGAGTIKSLFFSCSYYLDHYSFLMLMRECNLHNYNVHFHGAFTSLLQFMDKELNSDLLPKL